MTIDAAVAKLPQYKEAKEVLKPFRLTGLWKDVIIHTRRKNKVAEVKSI
jgi:hypothetical protein